MIDLIQFNYRLKIRFMDFEISAVIAFQEVKELRYHFSLVFFFQLIAKSSIFERMIRDPLI